MIKGRRPIICVHVLATLLKNRHQRDPIGRHRKMAWGVNALTDIGLFYRGLHGSKGHAAQYAIRNRWPPSLQRNALQAVCTGVCESDVQELLGPSHGVNILRHDTHKVNKSLSLSERLAWNKDLVTMKQIARQIYGVICEEFESL